MLSLFRKYQKGLFLVVSVVVLSSFAFFGVQRAGFEREFVEKDGDVGVAVDGSKMRLRELNRMKRLLRTDVHDTQLLMAQEMPNMLNPGVIRSRFLETGLAKELFAAYKEELKAPLFERVAKHKRFKPYAHKDVPFLSVEGLWQQIAPEMKTALHSFKQTAEGDYEGSVDTLLTLYGMEQKLPPHMLKQFLHYQAQQLQWVEPDAELMRGNFALFRAKHVGDWFGERFVDLVAQTVLNGAIVAEKAGYVVTRQEAQAALYKNAQEALRLQKGGESTPREVADFVANQCQHLGLSEQDTVALWKKVLLFEKYFDDVGNSVFVDAMGLKQYQEHLNKKIDLTVYHFAESMGLTTFRDMIALQYYIDAVTAPQARKAMHILDLPQAVLPAERVEQKTPALTALPVSVSLRTVTEEDLLMDIPVQDVWAQQLDDAHFAWLQKETNVLGKKTCSTMKARERVLEALDDTARDTVDLLTRKELLKERPELLEKLLAEVDVRNDTLYLSAEHTDPPLPGISDGKALREALLASEAPLAQYTQDNKHFYTIELTETPKELELLSFVEAKNRGILDVLVTRHLEKKYSAVREHQREQFVDETGGWKPFRVVNDAVAKLVYAELCDALDTYAGTSLALEEYPQYRFAHFLESVCAQIADADGGHEFFTEGPWPLTKETVTLVRSQEQGTWFDLKAFETEEGVWSRPLANSAGRPFFYHVDAVGVDEDRLAELMEKEQRTLSEEAQKELLGELIQAMNEADAVHFDYEDEE